MNYNFYVVFPLRMLNDERFKNLGTNDFFLYMLLLNRVNASKKNLRRFSDKKGVFVLYSNRRISEDMRCNHETATRLLNNLEQAGLIKKEYQQRGLPLKIYVNDIRDEDTYSSTPAAQEKDVSFDARRTTSQKQKDRRSFGDKKSRKTKKKIGQPLNLLK